MNTQKNNILDSVENFLELDNSGVWVLDKFGKFGYSDGLESEKYLRSVLSQASDLSCNSYELESYIKDWNSEYHLSRKRAQLLKGFNFDKRRKVLEVGCGCGAITRFLGETFGSVTAIEGSIARAEIARMRTKDLDNVSIICAPFQEIAFKEKFDMILCIGVFEYSNMFVEGIDPYDNILKYFSDILNPEGEVVIAIENQFGLKYFNSSTEDHSAVRFDGLEGYARFGNKNAKTFGFNDLQNRLSKYFPQIDFYFPFPDYKMPTCIISQEFARAANVGELVGSFDTQTSYLAQPKALFDEKLVWLEIDKNQMIDFFSNSFLIFAGKELANSPKLDGLGVIYSENRLSEFQTITKFKRSQGDNIVAEKRIASGQSQVTADSITLVNCESVWINELSLHTQLLKLSKDKSISLDDFLLPVNLWLDELKAVSKNNIELPGNYLDCIWKNSIISNNKCFFIDREWNWNNTISLNRLFIKSFFEFLNDIKNLHDVNPLFIVNSKRKLIKIAGKKLSLNLMDFDFKEFIDTEAQIAEVVYGQRNISKWKAYINYELNNARLAKTIIRVMQLNKKFKTKLKNVRSRFSGKF